LTDSCESLLFGYNVYGVSANATFFFSGIVENIFMLSVRFVRNEGFWTCSAGIAIVKRRSFLLGGAVKVLIPSFMSEVNVF